MNTGQARRLEILKLINGRKLTSDEIKKKITSAKPSTIQTDLYILHKGGKIKRYLDGWVSIDNH
jgi:DeoR/GlpR family transcriptional regulator of sugar metabolism